MTALLRFGMAALVGTMGLLGNGFGETAASETPAFVFGGSDLCYARYRTASDEGILYCWSLEQKREIPVWRSPYVLRKVSQAPISGFPSCIEAVRISTSVYCSVLRVFSIDATHAEVVCSVENVHEYAWAPDGKRIAYCQGTSDEDYWTGYKSSGILVVDSGSEQTTKIADSGYRPFWAPFDGNLYFEEVAVREKYGVYRYDFEKRNIEKTSYKSTSFSMDGIYYYYAVPEEAAPFELYRRETNALIGEESQDGIPALALQRLEPIKWADDTHIAARAYGEHGGPSKRATYLANVRSREIRKCVEPFVGIMSEGVALVVKPGGKLEPKRIEDMPVITADQLPKSRSEKSEAPTE